MTLFRALKHCSFALLWSGQTISSIGDFLYEVILAWWVLEQTGSALMMGIVLICSLTPMVMFSLIGGVMVDRFPRVWVMLMSDAARAVIVSVVTLLAMTQLLAVWHILVASVLFGVVEAFFRPAYIAFVPDTVPEQDLPSANALTSMSVQIGRIAGPALGASVIALVGTAGAFAINAFSFGIAVLCITPLLWHAGVPQQLSNSTQSILADIREGITTVLASPILWSTMLLSGLINILLAGPYSVAMPFLVKEQLSGDVGTLGLLYAMFPIGYLIGGIGMGRLTHIHRRGLIISSSILVAGVMLGGFSLPLPLLGLMLAAGINGAALEIEGQVWTHILQDTVPNAQLGRVASIDSLGSFALLPLGYAITGWATDQLGAAPVFLLGGGLTAVCALLALSHPAIRAFD